MVKLRIFVACERVLIDQQQNGIASLIALFDKLTMTLVKGAAEIPANAVAPKEWAIFSKWDTEPEDAGKEFTICTQILYPDQSQFGELGKTPLKIEANKKGQAIVKILGFPLGQEGFYTVRTWLEENGSRIGDAAEFKLELEIVKSEQLQ